MNEYIEIFRQEDASIKFSLRFCKNILLIKDDNEFAKLGGTWLEGSIIAFAEVASIHKLILDIIDKFKVTSDF